MIYKQHLKEMPPDSKTPSICLSIYNKKSYCSGQDIPLTYPFLIGYKDAHITCIQWSFHGLTTTSHNGYASSCHQLTVVGTQDLPRPIILRCMVLKPTPYNLTRPKHILILKMSTSLTSGSGVDGFGTSTNKTLNPCKLCLQNSIQTYFGALELNSHPLPS